MTYRVPPDDALGSASGTLLIVELLGRDVGWRIGDDAGFLGGGGKLIHRILRSVDKLVYCVLILPVQPLQLLHIAITVLDQREDVLNAIVGRKKEPDGII